MENAGVFICQSFLLIHGPGRIEVEDEFNAGSMTVSAQYGISSIDTH